ncbi:ABC transporter substrate-binding protein [Paenarthrobacter sp. AR 02]|uniref:substrate-binding periplasmic protein n=1 Tax=Paenarthrobacter sp. AR 02 TaxID=2899821 RepID=UPI001F2D09C8|nr:transporter substrate-binding domain-containing protein [Paenarthrobacter sp. AR 02]MCF3140849.1 ABC transporter substrate-binding protein [Paenarthrobacter sp. AR 02]
MKSSSKLGKRLGALLPMAVAAAVALSACGGGSSGSSTEQKTLTIATSNDAPFSFTDASSGQLTGIDGEMINAIAEAKGWKVKTFVTDFNTLIPALQAKKADVIVDAMYITDKRKEQINFTDPWYVQGEGMLVPGDSTLKSRDDVKGKVLGAQTGTVFTDFIGTLGASQTKFFDSQAALISAVENKQVDAAFTDSAVVAYSLVQKPNPKIKLVSPYTPYYPGTIGAGVRKDDSQLLADLNSGLAELKKSPKYLEILKKYGLGEDNVSK